MVIDYGNNCINQTKRYEWEVRYKKGRKNFHAFSRGKISTVTFVKSKKQVGQLLQDKRTVNNGKISYEIIIKYWKTWYKANSRPNRKQNIFWGSKKTRGPLDT
jgi:hypothetical protein